MSKVYLSVVRDGSTNDSVSYHDSATEALYALAHDTKVDGEFVWTKATCWKNNFPKPDQLIWALEINR